MLPKQQIAMYTLTVPSTGQEVKYRPFTVREEKWLMLAKESSETPVMIQTLKEIIKACTEGKVDPDKLAVFDLEFIMATLRSKSVGEAVKLDFGCDADPKHDHILLDVDLSKIEVIKDPKHNKKIPLFDDVGVIMKYPDLTMLDTLMGLHENPNMIFGVIYDCIDKIYNSKEVFEASEQSEKELEEFIEGLTKDQFGRIEDFFTTMPMFSHTIEFKCPTCGKEHKKTIEGFENFF